MLLFSTNTICVVVKQPHMSFYYHLLCTVQDTSWYCCVVLRYTCPRAGMPDTVCLPSLVSWWIKKVCPVVDISASGFPSVLRHCWLMTGLADRLTNLLPSSAKVLFRDVIQPGVTRQEKVRWTEVCVCVVVISDVAAMSFVSSGIVTSSQMFSSGYGGAVFAGILMLIIGLMFGALAALDFFMLLRVSTHSTVNDD